MARPAILGTTLLTILQSHHLLNVAQLLSLLAQQTGKHFNKTSVYRALEKLEEEGFVCQHVFSSGETKYELRHHHHDHLVCTQCGQVTVADALFTIPTTLNGFQTDHYHLTIFGLCETCQKEKRRSVTP